MLRDRVPIRIRRIILGIALIGVTTYVGYQLLPVNATTVGFVYLVEILLLATGWGFLEALCASVIAALLFNFHFMPPVGRLTIADPQNWIALIAFMITAIVAGQLSARIRDQAREATRRREEVERLYSFSRAILLTDSSQPAGAQIARQIAQVFECPAAAVYDAHADSVYFGGQGELAGLTEALRAAAVHGTYSYDDVKSYQITPVRLGGQPIGSLAVSGTRIPEPILDSLVNLVAISLERTRSQEAASRAEVARQSEELKSTLLDSIAHEFKTPLTSIKAAASGLLADPHAAQAEREELAAIVDEEADRLSRLVTEVIQMSRIEAGKIRLERRLSRPLDLVNLAIRSMPNGLSDRAINVRLPVGLPLVEVDQELMTVALRHLLDNAAKYSPAGTPIEISAEEQGSRIVLEIKDCGSGIPEKDRLRIFEKFYRAENRGHRIPGSGMGLSITRDIVRVHGGEIWADARSGPGSILCVALPVAKEHR